MLFCLKKQLIGAPNTLNYFNLSKVPSNLRRNSVVNVMEASTSGTNSDDKSDLSRFKISPKRKLSNKSEASETQKKSVKRTHVKIDPHLKKNGPKNWEQVLSNIREMRKNFDAPVDSMGCNKCQEESASPEVLLSHSFLLVLM